jgi:phospholipid/cholesterol/gamma-HCH transport system substrate-binding protein
MESRREQAFVGVFVIIAAGLLLFTLLYISGTFRSSGNLYYGYFKNAGGMEKGGQVRYAGGPPIGRITEVKPNPQDPTQMKIEFRVEPDVPVKTDSKVKISSLSPLGENFLAIVPGSAQAALAPNGSRLTTADYFSLDELEDSIGELTPKANELMTNLNKRVEEMQDTIKNINEVLDTENRQNIRAMLKQINGMLAEDRKPIKQTLANMQDVTDKLKPMLDDFKVTMKKANDAIDNANAMIQKNDPKLQATLDKAKDALNSAQSVLDQLDRTLNTNSGNLDEIIENFRQVSQNMKEFTETIKTRPYTLIRSSAPKPRRTGEAPPQ